MSLNNLRPPKGAKHAKTRVGRGPGSGHGKTAGRGEKGAQSRSGFSFKRGFEGGQMPLHRRLPKRGFTNPFRVEYTGVNLDALQQLSEAHGLATVDLEALKAHGLIGKKDLVKILGRGELKAKLEVTAHAFSKTAAAAIEAAGGTAVTL